jgi:hypothetical protein
LINTGVLDDQGIKVLLPARIYVDDVLVLATSKENIEQVKAALIRAVLAVMGAPDTSVCQCKTVLGLITDTNRMTISVPNNYIQTIFLLINSTWHTYYQQLTAEEAQEFTG